MKYKHLIISLLVLLFAGFGAKADGYFQYPIVPDSLKTLRGRCDYLTEHFFDFCDLKKGFSNRAKMGVEICAYISIANQATPAKAITGIQTLMKKLEKQPKDQLFVAQIAEAKLYSDTADTWADDLYIPFAEAIAANKKIDKAERARFEMQAKVLSNSLIGQSVPVVTFTKPDGSTANLADIKAPVVVVFFNDPDCTDCMMARVRLNADTSLSELIQEGKVKVVAISTSDFDDAWKEYSKNFPAEWTVGTNPDVDLQIDLRTGTPDFYVLDQSSKVHFKHLSVDQVIDVARQLKKR